MISWAHLLQLVRDMDAVRHEARRLEDGTKLGSNTSDSGRHSELTHVRLHFSDVVLCHELLDAIQSPARRKPRVFVEEEPPLAALVVVDVDAELDVAFRLLHAVLELRHPLAAVLVHVFV